MLAIPVFSLTSINYHHSGTVDVVVAVFVYTLCLLICTQSNIYRRLVAMHTIRMIHATNRMQPTETGIDDLFGKTTTKINDNVENKAHVMLTQAIRPELEIENSPKKKNTNQVASTENQPENTTEKSCKKTKMNTYSVRAECAHESYELVNTNRPSDMNQ